ncbi:NAD(+) diphosphatase [Alteromonas sp. ASW11-130]|uniref:NAD(+) diphosphatase n=1 Tax=Alteromonas sp. ASW11-130 TaxID=3015775 RepID=UPI0022420151|nr:NAD(+) diphosphatase [Alteromonas sp. ASW11-130]MCW8090780.1 NAD(+) diphosphatase [Alteromonas sp. ASW11-130]
MLKKLSSHAIGKTARWLLFSEGKLLIDPKTQLPPVAAWENLQELHHHQDSIYQLLPLENENYSSHHYVIDLGNENIATLPFNTASLRSVLMAFPLEFSVISRAWQYTHFYRTHRYCGQCGMPTTKVDWEVAIHCHHCSHRVYPRVSPCVIMAIYKDNEILLAKGVRHKESGMFSTLAGFVESGESLEQAVHREVKEEVGVEIENLEYFGSQPWPFPHSLMVGYIAKYKQGEIQIDKTEIVEAEWFNLDNLPLIPPTFSIAGQLIQAVKNRQ